MTTPRATPAGGQAPAGTTPSASAVGAPTRAAATVAPPRGGRATPAGAVGSPAAGMPGRAEPGPVPGVSQTPPRRAKAQRRPPRLASLQLKRIDPWTVLKISLIVAIVMFFVWMIAVGVLYLVLGGLEVWDSINSTWATLTSASAAQDGLPVGDLITPGDIFGWSALIGAVNIVVFTALATIAAFVYNAAAGMAGGIEVTLGERD